MKILWLLCFFVVLPAVLGQAGFGRSYLKNSRLCHQWNCINTKLSFPDSLPPREQSEATLRRLLPEGTWQDVVGSVLDHCYGNRSRAYTNTCPGQALMHCVVDQMIDFCPVSSWRKDDSCSSVSSLAGLKYMFAQGRYINLERNLPREHRPTWFLKNFFSSKCCDLPVIFNSTLLEECGFTNFITYSEHGPRATDVQTIVTESITSAPEPTTPTIYANELQIVSLDEMPSNDNPDPLDCCHMSEFIHPAFRSECNFELTWAGQDRLVITNHSQPTEAPTTTTERPDQVKDLMLLPHTCEKETCVFRNLGIISETGAIDIDSYINMLNNFTNAHPDWTRAKARVLTKCLTNPSAGNYEASCEINSILTCTFDVLTENCPYKRKSNICKHGQHDSPCQISSSKYRPKNRREICLLPEIVHHDYLAQCGLQTLYRAEYVTVPTRPRSHGWLASGYTCKDSKAPTACVMNKMGVLNKYNFMDYFKMKDRIRQFTSNNVEWSALVDVYMSAFINIPMYGDHCNSEKKLLNVLDSMLMTCPISKRKNTTNCKKLFADMVNTPPNRENVTKEKLDEIMKHYHHVFMPNQPSAPEIGKVIRRKVKTEKKPVYDFAFLNSKDASGVQVIDIPRRSTTDTPLILQPVYLRPNYGRGPVNSLYRSNPFWLHEQMAKTQSSTYSPILSTVPTTNNNVYSTRPLYWSAVTFAPQSTSSSIPV